VINRVRFTLYMLVLAAAVGASALAEESIIQVVKQVSPAVVTVITYDSNGEKQSQGSGFYIDTSHVITGWHVIEDASRAEVKCANGKVYQVKAVVAKSESADLAKLELAEPNLTVTPLMVSAQIPQPGERVVVVGSPLGLEATITDGIVSGVRDIPELGQVIQISAPISKGSSGSPVVNMNGEVVGVVQAIRGGGQNLNFATPGPQILALKPTGNRNLAAKPGEIGRGPAVTMDESFATGLTLFQAEEYEKALPYFLEVVRHDPGQYLGWFMVGHCYINLGKYNEAAAAFLESIKIKPDFVDGYCSLGAALGLMGRHRAALDAFTTAIKIDPNSALAHYGLGLTYLSLGEREQAVKQYGVLLKLDPELAERLYRLME